MALHEVQLKGYSVRPGNLSLGTFGSYGIEQLHVTFDDMWSGLAVTATFNPPKGEPFEIRVPENGLIDVPAEVTANAGTGTIVYCGVANGVQRITKTQGYNVITRGNVGATAPFKPSESLATQVLQAALNAEKNSAEAKSAAASAVIAAENSAAAAKISENAAANSATAAKASENAAAASADKAGPYAKAAQAAQEAAENAAAAAAASKSAADTLAAEAARAAKAAEDSKAAANNAANFAGENATAAQQAATTATAAAKDAGKSASDATASKAAAETAAKAAQDAQTAAAAAKAEAVKAQEAAQTAAKSAQDAQAAAEKARDEAKTAQNGAEAARDTATKSAEAAAKSEANAKQSADTLAESVENVAANTAAVAELKQQVKNITPDDSSIGDKPWSSKHIIDMLCPPLEESGNPVVCYPVAGYPLGVKASWEPMQEGTGTPSPENIRPIKGRDSVTVERCGENLLNPKENLYNTYTPYGLTITYIGDNKVHLKGTYNLEGVGSSFVILDSNQNLLAGRGLKITGFAIEGTKQTYRLYGLRTKDETAIAMNAQFANGDVIDMVVAVVVSKDTPTTYTPYIGQTNTLTLPETVYGGEVDAVSGDGQETWKLLTLDGTERWMREDHATSSYSCRLKPAANSSTNCLCSMLPWKLYAYANKGNEGYFSFESNGEKVHFCVTKTWETVDAWKAYLAAQKAAGTPVQVAYKLAEPVPFTATGAQPLPALSGVNTMLTDADSTTVTGRADPIKRITDLEDAVASQT